MGLWDTKSHLGASVEECPSIAIYTDQVKTAIFVDFFQSYGMTEKY